MKVYEYARFKRCMDWYTVDDKFREMMESAPFLGVAMLGYGDVLDPVKTLQAIKAIFYRRIPMSELADNDYYKAFLGKDKGIAEYIHDVHRLASFPTEESFYYLDTQRNRCRMECGAMRYNPLIYYYPYAIELAAGCSVQCPFCALEPKRLKEVFPYNEENSALFKGILQIMKEKYGRVAGMSPCYLATEPLDNPDYERFVADYREVLGTIPQTTTATAEKNVDRIKAMLMDFGYENVKKYAAFRFSVKTMDQFRQIAQLYSPEEMMNIEVMANNPESMHAYSDSGRAAKIKNLPNKEKRKYSISCVAGFRINLAGKWIEYVEPEVPDEEFHRGYRVIERVTFTDIASFKEQVQRLSASYGIGRLPVNRALVLNKHVRIEEKENQYEFHGDEMVYPMTKTPAVMKLVQNIKEPWFVSEVMQSIPSEQERRQVLMDLSNLFRNGYIRLYTEHTSYI